MFPFLSFPFSSFFFQESSTPELPLYRGRIKNTFAAELIFLLAL